MRTISQLTWRGLNSYAHTSPPIFLVYAAAVQMLMDEEHKFILFDIVGTRVRGFLMGSDRPLEQRLQFAMRQAYRCVLAQQSPGRRAVGTFLVDRRNWEC